MAERYSTPATPDQPSFDLTIGGESVGPKVLRDVLEIDVDERVSHHAIAQIMLQNWDPDQRAVTHSTGELFALGEAIEVHMGYHGELRKVFSGVVTGVTARFPASSVPVAVINARSRSILLASTERPRVFEEVNHADRFEQIASEYGLTADVGESSIVESQFDIVSDWRRVTTTAERHGWVSYVRDDELVIRNPSQPDDPIELKYGTSILELDFDEDIRYLTDPIKGSLWDPGNVAAVESEAEAAGSGIETGQRLDLSEALQATDLPLREGYVALPETGVTADADAVAAGGARLQQLRHIKGQGVAIGLPDLRIDQWLDIAGTGERFDGPHYVSAVRHRLGRNGYTTEFVLGLETPLLPPNAAPTSPDLAIGLVVDLEDPEGWGRVKVEFPWAGTTLGAVWARLVTLDAGADFGTLFVPGIGHEVVVGFAAANPVVLGAMWNGNSAPPEAVDPNANDVRLIKTSSGHQIRFHDGNDALIEIKSGEGSHVLLDDANGAIEMVEKDGNKVVINGDGISLTAATGDIVLSASQGKVKIEAVGIEGKATGPSKLESSATFDISASATLGLKGALVNIN